MAGQAAPQTKTESLEVRLAALRKARRLRELARRNLLFVGAFGSVGVVIYLVSQEQIPDKLLSVIIPAAYLLILAATFSLLSPRSIELDIANSENELDLLSVPVPEREQRAEKLFRLHQSELDKYYNQTLQHGSWIFISVNQLNGCPILPARERSA